MLKDQEKNNASYITSKLIDHFKTFHLRLELGKLYMEMHSINDARSMSAMFTTGVGQHVNTLHFDNYMANQINK